MKKKLNGLQVIILFLLNVSLLYMKDAPINISRDWNKRQVC